MSGTVFRTFAHATVDELLLPILAQEGITLKERPEKGGFNYAIYVEADSAREADVKLATAFQRYGGKGRDLDPLASGPFRRVILDPTPSDIAEVVRLMEGATRERVARYLDLEVAAINEPFEVALEQGLIVESGKIESGRDLGSPQYAPRR